jgi:hypothetical protein
VAVVALTVMMRPSNDRLVSSFTPLGIVSRELAATRHGAAVCLDAWRAAGAIDDAVTNVVLDYPFLVAYATFLTLASFAAADVFRARPRLARVATALAWGATVAGALDAVENVAMLAMLHCPATPALEWPLLAAACAAPKFVLALGATVIGGAAGLAHLLDRRSAT